MSLAWHAPSEAPAKQYAKVLQSWKWSGRYDESNKMAYGHDARCMVYSPYDLRGAHTSGEHDGKLFAKKIHMLLDARFGMCVRGL